MMISQGTLLWSGFIFFIGVMLALDLGVFQRGKQVMGIKQSLIWCGVWAGLAMLFNVGIFVFHPRGTQAGLEFFTGYLTEQSLSFDNIFVFVLLFEYFKVPRAYQHKVLFWGVLGAVILRGTFVLGGLALVSRFAWMIYVFGAFLVFTGINMTHKDELKEIQPERNVVMRIFRRFFQVSEKYDGRRFFIRKNGKFLATPLLAVLVAIESTDILFAVDSIPAIFAITRDPFLVFSSNIFAVLGIRALYFAVSSFMESFYFVRYGFALILVILGVKMLLGRVVHVPVELSLVLIVFVLLLCVIVSLLRPRKADLKRIFGRTARLGLIPFRRLLVIENIIDHADLPVRAVMHERGLVSTLRLDAPWSENLRILREKRFSRYPIVDGEIAKPLGILHVMDLALAQTRRELSGAQLKDLARPALELREDLSLTETFARFRHHSDQMGIILDATGTWVGIVTIEDLFEQLVGEIEDEFSIGRNESPIGLADALSPGRVVLELHAGSMSEAIENIICEIPEDELPVEPGTILRALLKRTEEATNYLGAGVVAPHARIDGLRGPMLAFARSREGVEIGAHEHAEIFFLAACPNETRATEAHFIASIARLIDSEYVLQRLREAETAQEVIETIRVGEQLLPV